jgi:NAD(P)-dependent dehydrogenase (short-subunit alcohol dehydrogenase family)
MARLKARDIMRLEGKVAMVTGGSRGIGRAIAQRLARVGARVAIASRTPSDGQAAVRQIVGQGGQALYCQADVSRRDDVARAVRQAEETLGPIEILINNAGIHRSAPFVKEGEDLWQELFQINVMGVVLPTQAVVPGMVERGGGRIVIMSSKAAIVGEPGHAAYSASKGAILSLTRALAVELAPHQITVNAICPGPTMTSMTAASLSDPEHRRPHEEAAPLGRIGQPEDIAGIALYFASDESAWCTGQALAVDGGLSILK